MLKAMKEIHKILDIIKQMIGINTARLEAQDKRIKSLEFMVDKYITNNDALDYHSKIDKKYGYDEVEWNRISGDPYDDDDELMINNPDDGSWKGR
tara:strand:+ start:183 stop:467 length:285 start_codon:yes stop_codon:yes gene_type:complete